jgi:hypothetical protein
LNHSPVRAKVTESASVEDNGFLSPATHARHAQGFHPAPLGLAIAAAPPSPQRRTAHSSERSLLGPAQATVIGTQPLHDNVCSLNITTKILVSEFIKLEAKQTQFRNVKAMTTTVTIISMSDAHFFFRSNRLKPN